eukprot:112422-Pleurochrysis_carterae.AAC.1
MRHIQWCSGRRGHYSSSAAPHDETVDATQSVAEVRGVQPRSGGWDGGSRCPACREHCAASHAHARSRHPPQQWEL